MPVTDIVANRDFFRNRCRLSDFSADGMAAQEEAERTVRPLRALAVTVGILLGAHVHFERTREQAAIVKTGPRLPMKSSYC